ncbi:TetR/AcrR family transcriptional regulator [Helicovermis profundi]
MFIIINCDEYCKKGDNMTGRREKKKREIKDKIIKAAEVVFFEDDYEKITVSEIANRADIGVGTIYNYFKSKDDIFVSTMKTMFDIDYSDININKELLNKPNENNEAVDLIVKYNFKIFLKISKIPKVIIKKLFQIMLNDDGKTKILSELIKLDFKYIYEIEKLIKFSQEKGKLKSNFDAYLMAETIYSIVGINFAMFMYNVKNFDETMIDLEKKIRMVLNEYVAK